ncbi:MAG: hypothetical protein J5645_05580 [Lachnospiraceae bacterium]|nr:hypothetical protein [Lachnospiraceae bacterium]
MKSIDERIALLNHKVYELQRKRERRLLAVSGAACLALFAALLVVVKKLAVNVTEGAGELFTGSSLLGDSAGGYVLVAVVAFMLGVVIAVTIKRYRAKQANGTTVMASAAVDGSVAEAAEQDDAQ